MDPHENNVNLFYSTGLKNIGIEETWPLTFGYWLNEDDTYEKAAENIWKKIYGSLDIKPDSILAVIGCGMGLELIYVYNQFQPKKIYAIDVTEDHVKRAQNLISQQNLDEYIVVFHGTGSQIDQFIKEPITHAVCIESTIQMASPKLFYKKIYDKLTLGGKFGIADSCLKTNEFGVSDHLFQFLISKMWLIPPENIKTLDEMINVLEQIGFDLSVIETIGDNVWIPYCDNKLKEFDDDIVRRGFSGAVKLVIINETIRFACKFTENVDYFVIVGTK
jgi:cyclopropane fatty-acyl-phospholipid synthase-like methyltransferase